MLRTVALPLLFAVPAAARGGNCPRRTSDEINREEEDREYGHGQHVVEVSDPALGGHRQWLLVVPNNLPSTTVPLVIDWPGYTESPYYQQQLVGLAEQMEKFKWIGAIPFGTAPDDDVTGAAKCCPEGVSAAECRASPRLDQRNSCSFNAGGCCGVATSRGALDVALARYIIQWAEKHMCVDTTSVFSTGFSNGAMMSNRIGCEAADVFAAVGPVAGNVRVGGDLRGCTPARPVGWASVCGTSDSACRGDIKATALAWAGHNNCDTGRGVTTTFTSATTECFRYEGCAAFVEWCEVAGLGHEWSGRMRPDTPREQPATNIDATEFLFDKFSTAVGKGAGAARTAARNLTAHFEPENMRGMGDRVEEELKRRVYEMRLQREDAEPAAEEVLRLAASVLTPRQLRALNVTGPFARCTSGNTINCQYQSTRISSRFVGYQYPEGSAPSGGWPVVVMYHGWNLMNSEWAWYAQRSYYYGLYYKAETIASLLDAGFAVITPDARSNLGYWETNDRAYASSNLNAWHSSQDHSFVNSIISQCRSWSWCNADRMGATGYSSGGYMTSRMAFHEYGFKALAIQAGSYYYCSGSCSDSTANQLASSYWTNHPPTLFFHGTRDSTVPASTSQMYYDRLRSHGVTTNRLTSNQDHEWLSNSASQTVSWMRSHL